MIVSAIIPTFNRAHLIKHTIESIANQTYPDIEIIIVDDGSTDNTSSVVSALSSEYCNRPIHYFNKANGGCASARNYGLKHAKGDFIAFLDDDDYWMPDAIASLVFALVNSKADFVYSPSIEKYPNGAEIINYPCSAGAPENFSIEHFKNTNTRSGSILYKRDIFKVVNGFDEAFKYNEDSDFLQRVAINFKATYSQNPTVVVRHHDSNKSGDRIEIYKALLKSNENILKANPKFKNQLGGIAVDRVSQIKSNLIGHLIRAGRFLEAGNLEKSLDRKFIGFDVKMALLFHSALPIKISFRLKSLIKNYCPS
ncbi:MAG: glycosyltransferase family A protein [Smithella sp.]